MLLAVGAALTTAAIGCGDKTKKDERVSEDDASKRKKTDVTARASSSAVSSSVSTPRAASTADASSAAVSSAPSGKYPDIDKLLGAKDKWSPVPFQTLEEEMAPAEVAKIFPGLDKLDEHGFSKIDVKDVPGVMSYEVLYLGDSKNQLATAEIHFDPKLTSDELWNALLSGMKRKYGDKYDTIAPRSLLWISDNLDTAELEEDIDFLRDPEKPFFVIKVSI